MKLTDRISVIKAIRLAVTLCVSAMACCVLLCVSAFALDISGCEIADIPDVTFTGTPVSPQLQIYNGNEKLSLNTTNFYISYSNNVNAGTATVTVKGIGKNTGTIKKTFKIVPRDISEAVIYASGYMSPFGPHVDINAEYNVYLLKSTDFSVIVPPSTSVSFPVLVRGSGNFTGTKIVDIEVVSPDISAALYDISMNKNGTISDIIRYDGSVLKNGQDYIIRLSDSGYKLDYSIIGINSFSGCLDDELVLSVEQIKSRTVISGVDDRTFTGDFIEPDVFASSGDCVLQYGIDYTLSYSNNINAGTAGYTLTGINNYKGVELSGTFKITPAKLENCTAQIPEQYYTGNELKPVPILKYKDYPLKNNKDFTIKSYSDNVKTGIATINISGTENFTGTLSLSFDIVKYSDKAEQKKVQQVLDEMMAGERNRQINAYIHSYKLGEYYNTNRYSPCTCHSYCYWDGLTPGCTCLIGRSPLLQTYGIQCAGFTFEVFEYLFADNNAPGQTVLRKYNRANNSWTKEDIKKWLSEIRPGDYLAYSNISYGYDHYVTVYDVTDEGLLVYEANYGGRCKINFRLFTYDEFADQIDDMWHRTPVNYICRD